MNDRLYESRLNRIRRNHFCRMPGFFDGGLLRMRQHIIGVLFLAGGFPQMMVVIAWYVDDLVSEKAIRCASRHRDLNKALKGHCRDVVRAESEFKDVAVQDQRGSCAI